MARWISITMLIALSASAASAQSSTASSRNWSIGPISGPSFDEPSSQKGSARIIAGTEVSPNARFGFGLFGMKQEKSQQAPVTVRELTTPKTRKAAVGFSLKF